MVEVSILTGFLGSGKTSFLLSMRQSGVWAEEKWAVIVNEFGQVGMDGAFLQPASGETVVEFSNGCICCTLKGDIREALLSLASGNNLDRILIEPSGIFALEELSGLFADPALSSVCYLGAIIAVVDPGQLTSRRLQGNLLYQGQIKYADVIVVSKLCQYSEETVQATLDGIRLLNPDASLMSVPWEDFDFPLLKEIMSLKKTEILASGVRQRDVQSEKNTHHALDTAIESFGLRHPRPMTDEEFRQLVYDMAIGAYGEVWRVKGYLEINGRVLTVNHTFLPPREGHADVPEGKHVQRDDISHHEVPFPPAFDIVAGQTRVSIIGSRLAHRKLHRAFWGFPPIAEGL